MINAELEKKSALFRCQIAFTPSGTLGGRAAMRSQASLPEVSKTGTDPVVWLVHPLGQHRIGATFPRSVRKLGTMNHLSSSVAWCMIGISIR
jgi:hypothetical protein